MSSSRRALDSFGDPDDSSSQPSLRSPSGNSFIESTGTSQGHIGGDPMEDGAEDDKVTVFQSRQFSRVNREPSNGSSSSLRQSTDADSSSNGEEGPDVPLLRGEANPRRQGQPIGLKEQKDAPLRGLVSDSTAERLYIAWVICFFAGSSLGAIFINKTCLTGYHFRYPLTLVLGQMAFALLMLTALHSTRYMTIPRLGRSDMSLMAIPTALFTSNVIVGLSALSLVNIPMFSAFRRLTLLFVMGAEYIFLQKKHSMAIVNAVVVMTFGAFISAIDDVSFSKLGYCLVFLNNVLTALYLASIKKVMRETQFQPLSLLYYTALMGFPVVACLILMTGELGHVVTAFRTQPELSTPAFLLSLTLTASGAFAVNFSTSLCTHVTSPLTTSVAGQVKNVLQTILGFFSWGFVPTMMNVVGLLVALGAQIVFAYLKYSEREAERSSQDIQKCKNSKDSKAQDSETTCTPTASSTSGQNSQ